MQIWNAGSIPKSVEINLDAWALGALTVFSLLSVEMVVEL